MNILKVGNKPVKGIFGGIFMNENTYYERKIRYLDLLDQGERVGGAGFLKMEVRGNEISLFLTVKGLHPTDTYERDVTLQMAEGEINIGQINLRAGQGEFTYHADMALSELRGIRIVLGGTREVSCKWKDEKRTSNTLETDTAVPHTSVPNIAASADTVSAFGLSGIPVSEMTAPDETLDVIEVPEIEAPSITPPESTRQRHTGVGNIIQHNTALRNITAENNLPSNTSARPAPVRNLRLGTLNTKSDDADGREMETSQKEEPRKAQRQTSEGSAGRRRKSVRLMEDKWQQISAIYPHIHPFRDEREYLSISPADFVMLTSKAYRAANNSFLLHGYYNYDHLILAKIEKRGEIVYYIGVPGSYYEREKQVAVMFGFESFECGTEPAQAGDFGYYMMRTEL